MNKKRYKLKEKRKEKGYSQQQVANILGISKSYYTKIEDGDRNPSLRICKKIINLFGVNISVF